MGYAGGTTPRPTYHRLGDHTETIQIDYDPKQISYEELLEVFWRNHRPTTPPWSRQYMSIVFYHDEKQRRAADVSKARWAASWGKVYTDIRPAAEFYVAEDYHQKYRLRADRLLQAEFGAMYPDPADLRDSTAAARVNGYMGGCAGQAMLERDIDRLGLSAEAQSRLRDYVRTRGRPGRPRAA